mgnify:CR=1 FL=1
MSGREQSAPSPPRSALAGPPFRSGAFRFGSLRSPALHAPTLHCGPANAAPRRGHPQLVRAVDSTLRFRQHEPSRLSGPEEVGQCS